MKPISDRMAHALAMLTSACAITARGVAWSLARLPLDREPRPADVGRALQTLIALEKRGYVARVDPNARPTPDAWFTRNGGST